MSLPIPSGKRIPKTIFVSTAQRTHHKLRIEFDKHEKGAQSINEPTLTMTGPEYVGFAQLLKGQKSVAIGGGSHILTIEQR